MKKIKKDFDLAVTNSKSTNEEINSSTIDNNSISKNVKKDTKKVISEVEKAARHEATEAIDFEKIEVKELKFIWYPFIPLSKLVTAFGDPGSLKTTQILDIASRVTNGGYMPLTNEKVDQGNVVYITRENDWADTIKPRLIKLGVNFKHFIVINENGKMTKGAQKGKSKRISLDQIERIKWILQKFKPTLFIIDPIQSYLPEKTDINKLKDVRLIFDNIIELSNKYECTFIFIAHTNKGDNGGQDKIMGSRDMSGAPRSLIRYGENPLKQGEILVEHVKGSLTKKSKSFLCKVIEDKNGNFNGIEYLGYSELSFEDFRRNNFAKKEKPIDFVKTWLKAELAYGGVDSIIVKEKASKLDIASATLNRAKEDLNIQSIPKGKQRDWALPNDKEDNDD